MAERNIDALLVSNVENVTYLCGSGSFDHSWALQFMTPIAYPTVIILPRNGGPVLIVHDVFQGVLTQAGAIDDVRLYFERGREEEQPYVQMTNRALESLGYAKGNIGIELGCGYTTDPKIGMPLSNLLRIEHGLPDAKFVDGSEILRVLRMIKSSYEIECIKRATAAIDKTFTVCFEIIEQGMSETEVVSVCNKILSEQGVRPVWTLAVVEHSAPLNPRPDVRLQKGNLLFLDLGATHAGYHSDFNRMAVVGVGTQSQHKACRDIATITQSTIEAIKPGITAADIVGICKNEYQKLGLVPAAAHETRGYGVHRKIGHGIGLTLSEAPQITTYDRTLIEPGMTFCIEPPLDTPHGFFVVEGVAAVTRDGCELLSRAEGSLYQI